MQTTAQDNSAMLWTHRRGVIDLSRRAAIMGILNVTPDSFSDGGRYCDAEMASGHALQMIADGAAIIDIGGESTRPGAAPVRAEDEILRVVPVIERLRAASDVVISIDTSKAAVAEAALAVGADIINDVTALRGDARMARVAASSGAGVVLMHMQGRPQTMQEMPQYDDVVGEVGEFLRQQIGAAVACGIDPMCVALDPGIGFGKSHEHNRMLIKSTGTFCCIGRPVVLGISRKSFLSWAADAPQVDDRLWAGVATTCLGRELGARIFRVHDVRPHFEAVRMTEAIIDGVSEL
jgi:dihydropteroate synthase